MKVESGKWKIRDYRLQNYRLKLKIENWDFKLGMDEWLVDKSMMIARIGMETPAREGSAQARSCNG